MNITKQALQQIYSESNQSQMCPLLGLAGEVKVLKYLIFSLIFVISVCGNCFVCWVVWRRHGMRTVMNYYLVNLASADLAFTLICIPFDLPVQESSCVWPFSGVLCKVIFPMQTMCAYASVFTLTAIGFSRYRAIVHPMKVQMGLAAAKRSILVIWVASFIFVLPYVLVLRVNPDTGHCEEDWPTPQHTYSQFYSLAIFVTEYALPLTVVFCSYLRIYAEVRKNPANADATAQADQAREADKVLRMSIAVTVVFAACALPNHIVWLVFDFNDGKCPQCNTWVILGNIFVFVNSAADPIVYTAFNEKYRDEFKTILRCTRSAEGTRNHRPMEEI